MNTEVYKLHKCLLMIAKEIKRICDKNGIKYFLIGGSLLGAVRHKGFIPWDDDMDFGMLRADYDRFINVCKTDLKDAFLLCSINTEKNYNRAFAKVRLKGTFFPDQGQADGINNGIFVDVFPIDVMPPTVFKQKYQLLFIKLWRNTLLIKYNTDFRSIKLKAIYILLTPFRLLSKEFISRRLIAWETKYNTLKEFSKYICFSSNYKYGKEVFAKESLHDNLSQLQFENTMFSAPLDYKTVLSSMYGDYLQLPPLEQQIFKHVEGKIDYGRYIYPDNVEG